jgi:hypothetical protein
LILFYKFHILQIQRFVIGYAFSDSRKEETDVPDAPYDVTDRDLVADRDPAAEP